MKNLTDNTALITGSGQGLGRAIALELAKAGANVIVSDLNSENAQTVASEIKDLGRNAIPLQLDVTDTKAIQDGVLQALNHFSRIDILINNAGVAEKGVETTTPEEFDLCYAVNVKGVWNVCNALIPHFKQNGGGKIVNIASIAGRRGSASVPAYCASKAAVISLTQSLAGALGPDNINVNAVCPGVIKTNMTETHKQILNMDNYFDEATESTALKRLATPEDIGHAVVFLTSPQAQNITGQSLNVDSGYCMN